MNAVARVLSPLERRMLDRDTAIHDLVASIVSPARLSPRVEVELRQAAAARFRRLADLTEVAAASAVALEREERAATDHVRGGCSRCCWRKVRPCAGLNRIRRAIDLAHHRFRRAIKKVQAF